LKFCTKTRGLTEEQNKQYAKDLKVFSKKEAKKFQDPTKESQMENDK